MSIPFQTCHTTSESENDAFLGCANSFKEGINKTFNTIRTLYRGSEEESYAYKVCGPDMEEKYGTKKIKAFLTGTAADRKAYKEELHQHASCVHSALKRIGNKKNKKIKAKSKLKLVCQKELSSKKSITRNGRGRYNLAAKRKISSCVEKKFETTENNIEKYDIDSFCSQKLDKDKCIENELSEWQGIKKERVKKKTKDLQVLKITTRILQDCKKEITNTKEETSRYTRRTKAKKKSRHQNEITECAIEKSSDKKCDECIRFFSRNNFAKTNAWEDAKKSLKKNINGFECFNQKEQGRLICAVLFKAAGYASGVGGLVKGGISLATKSFLKNNKDLQKTLIDNQKALTEKKPHEKGKAWVAPENIQDKNSRLSPRKRKLAAADAIGQNKLTRKQKKCLMYTHKAKVKKKKKALMLMRCKKSDGTPAFNPEQAERILGLKLAGGPNNPLYFTLVRNPIMSLKRKKMLQAKSGTKAKKQAARTYFENLKSHLEGTFNVYGKDQTRKTAYIKEMMEALKNTRSDLNVPSKLEMILLSKMKNERGRHSGYAHSVLAANTKKDLQQSK